MRRLSFSRVKPAGGMWSSVVIAGIMLGGCGLVDDPEPGKTYPDAPEGYKVALSLGVPGDAGKTTRAPYDPSDGNNHDQSASYFPDMYENALNVRDVAVYIFARPQTGDGDYSLIYSSGDDDWFRVMGSPLSGYNVSSRIPFDNYQLDAAELTASATVSLRLVILANQHTELTTSGGAYPEVAVGTTYNDAMNRISSGLAAFTLPQGWNPGNTVEGEPRYIPMYGKADFTVNALELYRSETWQTVDLSNIWMLRALGKVEINDNIGNEEALADRYPQIVAASLSYSYPSGSLLPKGFTAYTNGSQVESVNLGAPSQDVTTRSMTRVTGTYYADGAAAGRRVRFFRGYCPEQMIVNGGQPQVEVVVSPAADATEAEYSRYIVPLYGYRDPFSWGTNNQLLRNHIYRINVNSVGTPADITVQVMPWESEGIEWDFTDNPGFAEGGEITWTPGTYSGDINTGAARVYVNPVADGPAVCTFHMVQPQGATWRAFLIDTEGDTQNAFHFVDADGNAIDTPSGTVGEPATLRILPSQPAGRVTNAARLQVLVETADGRTIIADLCNGVYGGNTYFTIVQQGSGI